MWRKRLDGGETYVLDFLQAPDGRRFLDPRPAGDPPVRDAVLSSKPYRGDELMRWRAYGRVDEFVELEDGRRFVLDAHGVWLLPEEAEYLLHGRRCEVGRSPWFNGLPPVFPPK
jgi:hypothetical protein